MRNDLSSEKRILQTAVVFFLLLISSLSHASEVVRPSDADMWYLQARYFYRERFDMVKASECILKALKADSSHQKTLLLQAEMGDAFRFVQMTQQPDPVITPEEKTAEVSFAVAEPGKTEETAVKSIIPGTDDHDFRMALKQIEDLQFPDAVNSLKKNLTVFPENLLAWYYLFLIGERFEDYTLIREVFNSSARVLKVFSETAEYQDFLQAVDCYRKKLILRKAVMQYNRDQNLRKNCDNAFRYRFLDNDREKPDYPLMSELDLNLLKEKEYLKESPACPGGGVYSLFRGKIVCSLHGELLKRPYQDMVSVTVAQKKPVQLKEKHQSEYHINTSRQFVLEKRFYRAVSEAEQAIALNPLDYRPHDLAAQAYYGLERYDRALEFSKKAMELAVDEVLVYNNQGLILMAMGNFQEAVSIFRLAIGMKSSDFDLQYNLGICYFKLSEFQLALKHLEIASIIRPDSAGVFFNLGRIYQQTGKKEKARQAYTRMLGLIPADGKVYSMVVNILESL